MKYCHPWEATCCRGRRQNSFHLFLPLALRRKYTSWKNRNYLKLHKDNKVDVRHIPRSIYERKGMSLSEFNYRHWKFLIEF